METLISYFSSFSVLCPGCSILPRASLAGKSHIHTMKHVLELPLLCVCQGSLLLDPPLLHLSSQMKPGAETCMYESTFWSAPLLPWCWQAETATPGLPVPRLKLTAHLSVCGDLTVTQRDGAFAQALFRVRGTTTKPLLPSRQCSARVSVWRERQRASAEWHNYPLHVFS